MNKIASKAIVMTLLATSLSGCIGQMGTSQLVTKANLSAVDNRYGRAGLFVLLSPIYGIAATADLFIFNTVEFWTGKNPVTGKSPAVADTPVDAIFKVNDQLDPSLTTVPLASVQNSDIEAASFRQVDARTLEMNVVYQSGEQAVLRGERAGDDVNFYLDGEFITAVSVAELSQYANNQA
ncbi:DUF3332 domain-containing protein [Photobacterium sp. DNB23_23_1]|uniref:DUF3332 domain-containing protein n=1 Tax=Photobacterium pectinilyticum TaxID=2906793 RepID=A0ABT1MW18_9GAMM|nr:DUF3332 domain-containing protein [Photobacterium sp. ZSDE20]MCQ1056665.1 DUF3332 domain-containing protein [Photobacterium sp. ZSDE20]MDD1820948.1 DUF3332 domain-containing protein [Photobacterium sp. ZSDE20]